MNAAQSVVECETGDSAEQECRRVDDVGGKVEHFGQFDGRNIENILNVFKVSSGSQIDKLDTHAHEGDVANL